MEENNFWNKNIEEANKSFGTIDDILKYVVFANDMFTNNDEMLKHPFFRSDNFKKIINRYINKNNSEHDFVSCSRKSIDIFNNHEMYLENDEHGILTVNVKKNCILLKYNSNKLVDDVETNDKRIERECGLVIISMNKDNNISICDDIILQDISYASNPDKAKKSTKMEFCGINYDKDLIETSEYKINFSDFEEQYNKIKEYDLSTSDNWNKVNLKEKFFDYQLFFQKKEAIVKKRESFDVCKVSTSTRNENGEHNTVDLNFDFDYVNTYYIIDGNIVNLDKLKPLQAIEPKQFEQCVEEISKLDCSEEQKRGLLEYAKNRDLFSYNPQEEISKHM